MHNQTGHLAKQIGKDLPLEVLESARGFYIGTRDEEGPCTRESEEYWRGRAGAEAALSEPSGRLWTQRSSI